MTKKDGSVAFFREKGIRRHWDDEKELWYFAENKTVAQKGGRVAKQAKKELEHQTGGSIVSPKNAKNMPKKSQKKLR